MCVCSCLQIYLGTGVGGRHFLEIPEAPLEFGQYIVSLPSHAANETTISLSEKCHLPRSRQLGGPKDAAIRCLEEQGTREDRKRHGF